MNQKPLLIAIATLIVAIFAFAQVYIIFTVTTINDRINSVDQRLTRLETRFDKRFTELETRFDKRFNLIEARLDALNQNYINHLAHHIDK
jgi:flagellar capping protein FliD